MNELFPKHKLGVHHMYLHRKGDKCDFTLADNTNSIYSVTEPGFSNRTSSKRILTAVQAITYTSTSSTASCMSSGSQLGCLQKNPGRSTA